MSISNPQQSQRSFPSLPLSSFLSRIFFFSLQSPLHDFLNFFFPSSSGLNESFSMSALNPFPFSHPVLVFQTIMKFIPAIFAMPEVISWIHATFAGRVYTKHYFIFLIQPLSIQVFFQNLSCEPYTPRLL